MPARRPVCGAVHVIRFPDKPAVPVNSFEHGEGGDEEALRGAAKFRNAEELATEPEGSVFRHAGQVDLAAARRFDPAVVATYGPGGEGIYIRERSILSSRLLEPCLHGADGAAMAFLLNGGLVGQDRQCGDRVRAEPGLDPGAAPAIVEERDRRFQFAMEVLHEEIAERAEGWRGSGTDEPPESGTIVARSGQRGCRDDHVFPDQRIRDCRDFLRVVRQLAHLHAEIGLPAAEPDLAHDHVADDPGFAARSTHPHFL